MTSGLRGRRGLEVRGSAPCSCRSHPELVRRRAGRALDQESGALFDCLFSASPERRPYQPGGCPASSGSPVDSKLLAERYLWPKVRARCSHKLGVDPARPYCWEDGGSYESSCRGRVSGGTERLNLCPQLCPWGRNESPRREKGKPELGVPAGLLMSGRAALHLCERNHRVAAGLECLPPNP